MFNIYEKVLIKEHNIIGTIVDISEDDKKIYIVESDTKGKLDIGYGGIYPLFDCKEDELSTI